MEIRTSNIGMFLAIWLTSCCCLIAQTREPSSIVVPEPVASNTESAQDCRDNYSATQCTAENTKFLGAFDAICILAIPGLFLFFLPLLIGGLWARAYWWGTSPLLRWVVPMLVGIVVVAVSAIAVPFLPQVAPVTPESGLLKYLGVDPSFISACEPCRTRVTNRSPFYGLLPTGMPQQGLAPQYPYVLGGSILFALIAWSGLYWCAFILIKRFKGLQVQNGGG